MIKLIEKYKVIYKRDLQSCRDMNISVYDSSSWLKLHFISHLEQSIRGGKGRRFNRALRKSITVGCFCDRRINGN